MSYNKKVSKHEIYHEIIEHEEFDRACILSCAAIGHADEEPMLAAAESLLRDTFDEFGVNRKSRVAQAVRAELDDVVESFKETGCLRVEAFLEWWDQRHESLCPDCQSELCSDSSPPHS